jgi:hypothetical protein
MAKTTADLLIERLIDWAFCIENPGDCGRVLDGALATDGPVLIEAATCAW